MLFFVKFHLIRVRLTHLKEIKTYNMHVKYMYEQRESSFVCNVFSIIRNKLHHSLLANRSTAQIFIMWKYEKGVRECKYAVVINFEVLSSVT